MNNDLYMDTNQFTADAAVNANFPSGRPVTHANAVTERNDALKSDKRPARVSVKTLVYITITVAVVSLGAGMTLQKYIVLPTPPYDLLSYIFQWIREKHYIGSELPYSITIIPVLTLSVTIHEYGHAIAARLLGDDSVRLSTPWKFLNPIGIILVLTAGAAIAGQVRFNPDKFENAKKDTALIAVAGPAANLALAALCGLAVAVLTGLNVYPSGYISYALFHGLVTNLHLAGLNLLPFFPLDGEKIYMSFIPDRLYARLRGSDAYTCISLVLFIAVFIYVIIA
jgi:Zn-dependent protease